MKRSQNEMDSTKPKLRFSLIAGLFILFCCACFFLTRLDQAAASPMSLDGLTHLRAMAQQSVPYDTALSNGKPTLVEFYADWCTSCQALAPSVTKFHEQYGSQVNFVMLNVDESQWRQAVQQYHVRGVPQLFFITPDLQVLKTLIGKVPEPILAQYLEQLVNPTL
ncbi:thioredoxin domain-containing protein [Microcoleus sp. FACHB-SPT15]|uniref:thioredoxin domain-containing protein n=1 Tax=Microcoleus sp. FACHB-SPT15 TaxID=2692830 RepID=UPI0018EF9560|nr:thioredoxin domain-containing protein [Microcoleus sp. FACHB-SPT15]